MSASLFGIVHSCRNFADPAAWGKNQFNSAFPVALVSYLRDKKIRLPYICHTQQAKTTLKELSIDEVFGTSLGAEDLYFDFEARFDPYRAYVHDEMEKIDLVIKDHRTGEFIRPLEIKLTTLPDNSTCQESDEANYGSELVLRPATFRYVALSIIDALQAHKKAVNERFEPICSTIRNWTSLQEMVACRERLLNALDSFLCDFAEAQRPLLLQPIWKTVGKSAELAENCLDAFVWSDFSLARLALDASERTGDKISRTQRAALRLARFLWEATRGKVYQQPIYDGMSYDTQTDKEFSLVGKRTHIYMASSRLTKPIVTKQEIKQIILGGGQKFLSPERRFDAILYFSTDLFDE